MRESLKCEHVVFLAHTEPSERVNLEISRHSVILIVQSPHAFLSSLSSTVVPAALQLQDSVVPC